MWITISRRGRLVEGADAMIMGYVDRSKGPTVVFVVKLPSPTPYFHCIRDLYNYNLPGQNCPLLSQRRRPFIGFLEMNESRLQHLAPRYPNPWTSPFQLTDSSLPPILLAIVVRSKSLRLSTILYSELFERLGRVFAVRCVGSPSRL